MVVVAISHMMNPLAGMKQNQNQNLEADMQLGMLKKVDLALFHLNYIKKKTTKTLTLKSNKKSYFPVFPICAKNLSFSKDGNYR